jgi:hypothetical protein
MKFKIFTNDVGPHAYSCFTRIDAGTQADANRKAIRLTRDLPIDSDRADATLRVFAAPENADCIDGQTGRLKRDFTGTILEFKD